MALIVQKYGGTSVANVERIKVVAERVKQTIEDGNQVVVVVSARSGITNQLIERAKALNPHPDDREMDVLLSVGEQETIALTTMALHAIGVAAVSRTGAQAGITTSLAHTRARILDISGGDIKAQLNQGKAVIVAGFQGSADGHITTLGRGGSDLSAIAIAGAIQADICQIYTDVDGVYTTDPRVVKNAKKIKEISYEEMLELASSGTKVMQSRAVEFASKFNIPFEVRSSFNNNPGTIVKQEVASMEGVLVSGLAVDKNQCKVVVSDIPDKPGTAAAVFKSLAEIEVVVDMIIQNIGRKGLANLTFTVPADDAHRAEQKVNEILSENGGGNVSVLDKIAKISIVGIGMKSHSGVAANCFDALAAEEINIQMISTSEIKITVAIKPEQANKATQILHDVFNLEK